MQCVLIINKHSQTEVVRTSHQAQLTKHMSKCCGYSVFVCYMRYISQNVALAKMSRVSRGMKRALRIPSHLPRRGPPTGRHWWLLSLKLPETSLCTSDLTVEHTVCTQHKETKQRTFIKGGFLATQRLVSSVITKDTRALRVGDEQSRCGLRQ